MDQFNLIENFEECLRSLNNEAADSIAEDLAINYDRCAQCNILMTLKSDNQYVCTKCGLLNESVEAVDMNTIISSMNYNTMSNGLRCIGLNAHRYQTILRSQSSYEASPEIHARNILFAFNHKIGSQGAIPKSILLNVCEQFKHIRVEGTIYRGTILRAILAAMTYYECLRNRLLFKPPDIYKWFDVDSQTYSKGDKKVREMLDHGFLSEDIREINAEHSFLYAYSSKLDLSDDQFKFLTILMDFISENKLLNPNAKSSTRALCVLHIYLIAIKYPIKPEEFKEHFKCNYGTIRTISMDLFHASSRIIPVFEENGIPYDNLLNQTVRSKRVVRKRAKHGRIALD